VRLPRVTLPVRFGAAAALLTLALTAARAEADDVETDASEVVVPLTLCEELNATLTPPAVLGHVSSRSPHVDLGPKHVGEHRHPLHLSLDLGASYLRLAVHGDYKAGLAPFLGTTTSSLGGFRLRF
jgi:hypothetical protein